MRIRGSGRPFEDMLRVNDWEVSMTQEQVVRAVFQAYTERNRAALEAIVAEDFLFVSPLDHEIDRAKYFELCWPNSESSRLTSFTWWLPAKWSSSPTKASAAILSASATLKFTP